MFKSKKLVAVFSITVIALAMLVGFLRQSYCIPILMYHSVTDKPVKSNRLAVSAQTFERQMRFLKENHYNILPLTEIAALIKEKKDIPARTVAITFDDGYRDNYTYAFPILKKYSIPATVFIIINEIGREQGDRLSWDEVFKMRDSGVITIGSHALGPDPLTKIAQDDELKRQISESKKILEERLVRPVSAFSYPEGRFNAKIKDMVIAAGYQLAVATNPGKKFPNDNVFVLKRLRISENARNLFVFWVEASGYYNLLRERRHK